MMLKYYNATEGAGGGDVATSRQVSMDEINQLFAEPAEPTSDDTTDAPAETPEQTQSAEPAPQATETPAAEPQPAPAAPTPAPAQPEVKNDPTPIDWRETIKEADPTDVLRQVGLNDDLIGLIQHYNTHGNLDAYYEAKVKNWDNVPAESLLREQMRSEYAGISEEDFDALFQEEINSRYKLAEHYTDEERRVANIRLQNDANKIRATLKAEQAKFQVQPIDLAAKQREAEEAAAKVKKEQDDKLAKLVETINSSPVIQKLQQERKVSVKAGDAQVNVNVDPQVIAAATTDINKIFEGAYDANGYVTPEWAETLAFHFNRESFKKTLIDQGKSLGAKEEVIPMQNPSSQQPKLADPKPQSLWTAFGSSAREVKGSDFFSK